MNEFVENYVYIFILCLSETWERVIALIIRKLWNKIQLIILLSYANNNLVAISVKVCVMFFFA